MEVVVRRVPLGGGMPPPYRPGVQSAPPVTAALRYALAHPWHSLEHSAVVLLFVLYVSTVIQRVPCSCDSASPGAVRQSAAANVAQTGPVANCQLAPRDGPSDAFVQPGVFEAGLPTMQGDDESPGNGQVFSHHDVRGDIHRMHLRDGVQVNLMWTKGGTMRSGDMHNCTQYDVILRGKTRLRSKDLVTGEEMVAEYDGNNDFIAIPPRVPHLFDFVDDNFMIEWWACDFQAWYYKPLRDIIVENMKHADGKNAQ